MGMFFLNYEAISDRICKIRLKGKFRNTTIFTVHAPIEVSEEQEKEDFYDNLDKCIDKVPKHDMIVIMVTLMQRLEKRSQ